MNIYFTHDLILAIFPLRFKGLNYITVIPMLYLYIKAFHVIAFTSWMAGLFYLPRLFVYHAETPDQNTRETFKVMERKLLRYIINPAMILTLILGLTMVYMSTEWLKQGWLHAKIALVILLMIYHGYLACTRKKFERDEIVHTGKFYRYLNEIPTILLIGIVILAVVKPF